KISASDIVGIDKVNITIFGTTVTTVYNAQTGFYEYTYNTLTVNDGTYSITATAYDKSGKTASKGPINFRVNNDPPTLTINAPKNNEYVSGNYTVNATSVDAFSITVEYRVDNGDWVLMENVGGTNYYTKYWNTTTFSDGKHTLTVRSKDEAAKTSMHTIDVIVDNTLPSGEIASPIANQYIEGVFTFKVIASDTNGIKNVTMTIGSTKYIMVYNSATGFYEYPLATTTMDDGTYQMYANITDNAGMVLRVPPSPNTRQFYIDNNPPVAVINKPVNNEYVWGIYTINVTSSDTPFTPTVEYRIDGGIWIGMSNVGGTDYWTADWNTSNSTDGVHSLSVRAYDSIGHVSSQAVNVIVDNTMPSGEITSPTQNQYIEGMFSFKVIATDLNGIKNVTLIIGATTYTMVYNSATGFYETLLATTTMADGTYQMYVNITDNSGKVLRVPPSPSTRQFYIDNNAPIAVINKPINNEYVLGIYTVNVTSSDSPFTPTVEYRIDGGVWIGMVNVAGNYWEAEWNTSNSTDGAHSLSVRAYDAIGHVTLQSINVIVDNNYPTGSIISPSINQYIELVFTFRITATDLNGIDSVTMTINNDTTYTMGYNTATGFYEYPLSTTTMSDGTYQLYVNITDKSGKVLRIPPSPNTRQFYIDNNVPIAVINKPVTNEYVSGTYTINVTSSDSPFTPTVEYRIDGGIWVPLTNIAGNYWVGDWNTSNSTDEVHTVWVRAYDAIGHLASQSINVIVDNRYPTGSISSPSNNQYIEGVFVFKVVAMDLNGIDTVNMTITGVGTYFLLYNSISGFYEYALDTRTIGDGTYQMDVKIKDKSGKVITLPSVGILTFYIDNTFPTLVIDNPINDQFVNDTVTIKVNSSDGVFTPIVEYRIDGGIWVAMSNVPGTNNWTGDWDTTKFTEGTHKISVRSYDSIGHITSQSISVIVDNKYPTGSISSPSNNQYIEGVYVFKVTAMDLNGIDTVNMTIVGIGTYFLLYNTVSGFYEYALDTRTLGDGTYQMNVSVKDRSGKVITLPESGLLKFYIDNTYPTLVIDYPKSGQFVEGSINIKVNSSDSPFIPKVEYRIDGGTWIAMANGPPIWNSTWNTKDVTDGTHRITVRAYDNLSHITTQEIEVIVDNNEPVCAINTPFPDEFIEKIYTFKFSASDAIGIDKVVVELFGSNYLATYNTQSGYYELMVNTISVADDNYTINITAYDLSGKKKKAGPVNFSIDNTLPVLKITSPEDGIFVLGDVYINASVTDKFLFSVEYRVDTGAWVTMDSLGENWTKKLDSKTVADGKHTITVRAIDRINHITIQTITVTVDNNAPQCIISAPVENEYIEGIYIIKIGAFDAVGIANVSIVLFGNNYSLTYNGMTGYYEYTVNTPTVDDGTYSLYAIAYDLSGKKTETNTILINIDNTLPSLEILKPKEGEYVEGEYEIKANVSDKFLFSVECRVDSSPWFKLTNTSETEFAGILNTTNFFDGTHTITVKAIDKKGHITTNTIVFIIDNNPPTVAIISPMEGQYVEGTITFKISAVDFVGIEFVNIHVFNRTYTPTFNALTSNYEYTLSTIAIDDGTYNISVFAFDKSGKNSSKWLLFNVDNNYPTLAVIKPKDREYLDSNYTIEALAEDIFIDKVEVMIDFSYWVKMERNGTNWSLLWDTNTVRDGEHVLTVKATDNASHSTIITLSIIVDNTAPSCIIIAPAIDQYTSGAFTFKISAGDIVGIRKVVIFAFNKEFLTTYSVLTNYYEYTLSTTMYEDGVHIAYAIAYDMSGKETMYGPVRFNIDNNYPILTIKKPIEREYIMDIYEIEVDANDIFLSIVEYKIDNTEWRKMTKQMEYWYGIWDTPDFTDGYHTLTVKVTDNASHITSLTISVIIDNNPPICVVSSPVPNQYIEGTFTFRITASDSVGVDYVEINVYGATRRAIYNYQTGYYEYTFDTAIWAEDAIRNVSARAYDLSGKSRNSDTVFFRVDNHAPTLKIFNPKNRDFVSGAIEFNVTIIDAFPGPVEYNIDGTGWVATGLLWDTTVVADGEHNILIRGKDLAGHTAIETMILTVDNNDPTGWISSPILNQTIEGSFTFRVSGYDAVGIKEVILYIFDMEISIPYSADSGYYEAAFDTSLQKDGIYNLSAKITDYSGRSVSTPMTFFRLDNNPPAVTWVYPTSGAYISGEVRLNVIVEDIFLSSAMYTVDDTGWVDLKKIVDTTKISDGEHELTVRAVDTAGHITKSKITVIVDNVAPETIILSPIEGEHIGGVKTIEVYAGGGVNKVWVSIDNGTYTEIHRGAPDRPYEYNLDTKKLASGFHTIEIKSVDFTGHETLGTVNVIVDNDGPEINIKKPKGTQEGYVYFGVEVNDLSDVKEVWLSIGGGEWVELIEIEEGYYIYTWYTTEKDNGVHRYQIKAVDNIGNINLFSGSVDVKNPPNYGKIFLDLIPLLGFAFAVFAFALIIVLVRSGRFQRWLRRELVVVEEKPEIKELPEEKVKIEEEEGILEGIKEIKIEERKIEEEKEEIKVEKKEKKKRKLKEKPLPKKKEAKIGDIMKELEELSGKNEIYEGR
ncbi:MAG: Ig-like domain-containing protein, partial [Candidatus Thermoplasmatota archaeon]